MGTFDYVGSYDLKCHVDIIAVARLTLSNWGGIDVLVINAGPEQPHATIETADWSLFQEHIDYFLKSAQLLTQQFVPGMKERRFGRIIVISSEVVFTGESSSPAYMAAKAAQLGWMRAAALEFAPYGITVNAVAPGWIPVERHANVSEEERELYRSTVPVGRLGTPEDVAAAVCFLASEEASFITGQTLLVNGGRAWN